MVSSLKLFEVLKTRFGDTEARIIVEEIEKIDTSIEIKVEKAFDTKKDVLATREDIAKLEGRMVGLIAESKTDIIRWMFIFWIGQATVIIGIIIALFLKLK